MYRLSVLVVLFVSQLAWSQPTPDSAEQVKRDAPKVSFQPVMVRFEVKPWGEVIVDGKSPGLISPPMRSLKLELRKHTIDIKNVNHVAYTETIDVKSDEELTIRHKFSK